MRDKRPVDELSIEELEHILAIRRREERQKQLARMKRSGRLVGDASAEPPAKVEARPVSTPTPTATLPAQTITGKATVVKAAPHFEDDPPDVEVARKSKSDQAWKKFVNRSLLLVEIFAVVGLVIIGAGFFMAMGELERETAAAQSAADSIRRTGIPTIAPTPQLRLDQIVLPGGHKPPQEGGGFNYDEIPANLLPAVQAQINPPVINRPQPTDQTALALTIPKLGVDGTIVQGTDDEALRQGVGQLLNGVTPADPSGNVVLAAHNDIYGELFRHLDQLEIGDQFEIRTANKIYIYRVTGMDFVKANDVYVMDSTSTPTATLISCYPYQVNNQRIIIFAERVST